jgi:hypothetical protein
VQLLRDIRAAVGPGKRLLLNTHGYITTWDAQMTAASERGCRAADAPRRRGGDSHQGRAGAGSVRFGRKDVTGTALFSGRRTAEEQLRCSWPTRMTRSNGHGSATRIVPTRIAPSCFEALAPARERDLWLQPLGTLLAEETGLRAS